MQVPFTRSAGTGCFTSVHPSTDRPPTQLLPLPWAGQWERLRQLGRQSWRWTQVGAPDLFSYHPLCGRPRDPESGPGPTAEQGGALVPYLPAPGAPGSLTT